MKNKKNLPELRFGGFEGEWVRKKLGDETIKINSGKTPLGGESVYTEEGVLFIRSQNVTDDKLSFENSTFIPEEINSTMKNSIVKPNDILLNITGASLGRSCVVPNDFKTGNVNQHVCIIRLNQENDPRFIQPILSSSRGQNIFKNLQTGSGREGLNFESIRNSELRLPSLPEQQKIATFFSAIDEKLQALKRKKSLLEAYKRGVMQGLFNEGADKEGLRMRFKDDSWDSLPTGRGKAFPEWESKKGNEIFESISNKDHNSDLPILAITQEHGAIPRELIDYNISVTDKSVDSYKVVEVGDFIISLRSFQGGIEYSNYHGICSPAYIILRAFVEIDHRFYKYYFKTEGYIQLLNAKLEGIRDGKMISYKYFSDIDLPFPSLPEQTKISNFLVVLDEKINAVQMQIEKTEAWKKGLLQKMFC